MHRPDTRLSFARRSRSHIAPWLAACGSLLLCVGQWLLSPLAQAADPAIAANVSPPIPLPRVDEARARAAGIRALSSRRLVLYTDLPSEPSVDELPSVFDQAFEQWCSYFGIDAKQHPDWRMTASLMKDKRRFEAAGLMPPDLPDFTGRGYTRQYQCWVFNQTSPYYRRHLLLHEGTHGFMYTLLKGVGPPWYAEGMAELLATHRWENGRLTMNVFPTSSAETLKWERIEIVQNDFAAHRALRLGEVLAYDARAHRKLEPYGWSWAAAAFMENHPRYRDRFHRLWKFVQDPDFNRRVTESYGNDGAQLAEEFQVFVADITYGYDFERTQLDFTAGHRLRTSGETVSIAADRGWQNTGLRLEGGKSYRLDAKGRFQVNKTPRIWWSEPGGVSIRFIHGRPLGLLLAAVRPEGKEAPTTSALAAPLPIGAGTTIQVPATGTLYLRTNISSGDLNNAAGSLTVRVGPD